MLRISKFLKVAKKKNIIDTIVKPQHSSENFKICSCRLRVKKSTVKAKVITITVFLISGKIISDMKFVKSLKADAAKNAETTAKLISIIILIILKALFDCSLYKKFANGLRKTIAKTPQTADAKKPKKVYSSAPLVGIIITAFPNKNKAVAAPELL